MGKLGARVGSGGTVVIKRTPIGAATAARLALAEQRP